MLWIETLAHPEAVPQYDAASSALGNNALELVGHVLACWLEKHGIGSAWRLAKGTADTLSLDAG
jgi:hypothetical protein